MCALSASRNGSGHWLKEPQERVRELSRTRKATGWTPPCATTTSHSLPLRRRPGAAASACCSWPEVDWETRRIKKLGKGGKLVTVPITPTIRAILGHCAGTIPSMSSPIMAQRTRDGQMKGQRYPITYAGVKIAWRRLRKRAGVEGFRFHDFRHDFGTKLLRETGNLKLVQRALNHADMKTTTRYAHVLDQEVRRRWSGRRIPKKAPKQIAEEG